MKDNVERQMSPHTAYIPIAPTPAAPLTPNLVWGASPPKPVVIIVAPMIPIAPIGVVVLAAATTLPLLPGRLPCC